MKANPFKIMPPNHPVKLGKKRPWFRIVLQLQGSVVPAVLPRTLVCGLFGILISLLFYWEFPVSLPILAAVIPNIVLGLLLVFRTNTAYERFWEGRRLWGNIIIAVRNLARQIWITIPEPTPLDRTDKLATLHLLVAFAVSTKLHLRQEPVDEELSHLLSLAQCRTLTMMNNPPLEVAFWISDYLHHQYQRDRLDHYHLVALQTLVNQLVEALSGCERILKTPMPLAYAIHLKQLLLLYCLALPFQLVSGIGWWAGPVTALISFTLFGIEEIGIEIENPFGRDANDLPLDDICHTMLQNIEDLTQLAPSVYREHGVNAPPDISQSLL